MTEPLTDDDGDASTASDGASTDESILAGHSRHTIADVRETYREQAAMLGRVEWLNRLLTRRYRRPQFQRAHGRVLDVACGLATNAQSVPDAAEYVGIDVSIDVLKEAEQHAEGLRLGENLREMDAQDLDFEDDSFDTVISSLSTCTFPDPVEALREMGRVCRPGGRVFLVEHGRSDVGPIARLQEWRAETHFENHACRLTQRPLEHVDAAGLDVRETTTGLFGTLTAIEAAPGGV